MKRLRDELPDGFEARLLKAAEEEPSLPARHRALGAAMVTLAATAASASTAMAAAETANAPSGAVASAVKGGAGSWLVKTLVVLTLGGVAAGGALYGSNRTSSNTPATKASVSVAHVPQVETLPFQPPAEALPSSSRRDPLPEPRSDGISLMDVAADEPEPGLAPKQLQIEPRVRSKIRSVRAEGVASSGLPSADNGVTRPPSRLEEPKSSRNLTEQIAQLDSARAELTRGNLSQALVALEAYKRRWPEGAFRVEAGILQIEALVAAGRHGEAVAFARGLLATPEGAAYRSRIARMLAPEAQNQP
jgi:hypothetical protein